MHCVGQAFLALKALKHLADHCGVPSDFATWSMIPESRGCGTEVQRVASTRMHAGLSKAVRLYLIGAKNNGRADAASNRALNAWRLPWRPRVACRSRESQEPPRAVRLGNMKLQMPENNPPVCATALCQFGQPFVSSCISI